MPTPSRSRRWFAVILLQYNLRDPFWDRDAGLFYEGFKANGVDTRFVALGDPAIEQRPDLVLAPQAQMEDAAWWRQWELEGVVLYSWALPRFTRVTRALKEAGVRVVIPLDGDGIRSPREWFGWTLHVKYIYARMQRRCFAAGLALAQTLAGLLKSRHASTLEHMELADWLGVQSPLAKQRVSRFFMGCGRPDLVRKLTLLHHPIGTHMIYDPSVRKLPLVIAVGGWERLVKGAPLLVKSLQETFERNAECRARIIGSGQDLLRKLVSAMPAALQSRVEITGALPNAAVSQHYREAQVIVNTSYSEGFNLAVAEALCCGCSAVGLAFMSCMNYFCSEASGTMASQRSAPFYADALCAELEAWSLGQRDPARISHTWTKRLHANNVARSVLELGPGS